MSKTSPKVDAFIKQTPKWHEEVKKLRAILLSCPFTEELKWGQPCYTVNGGNVVLIATFKESCGLAFVKGALLADPHGILIQPTENTQSGRRMNFTSVEEIAENEAIIREYLLEAIEAEKAGLKVEFTKSTDLVYPEEFLRKLEEDPDLQVAFEALTPGRQRAYNLYFSAPKQSKTRESRIEKSLPQILAGKGLND